MYIAQFAQKEKMLQLMSQLSLLLPLLLLLLLGGASGAASVKSKRPNIVILLADDLGFGDIGANGNTTIRTPNIDRLAKEGVRLTQHLTAAPVCTPSRAALLTGKYPIRIGMVPANRMQVFPFIASQGGLPPNATTFATKAKAVGYDTALIGKWHLGAHCGNTKDFCHHPNSHGFDYFYGCLLTLLKDFSGLNESIWISGLPNARRNLAISLFAALAASYLASKLSLLSSRSCWLLALLSLLAFSFVSIIPDFGTRLVNSQLHRQHQLVEQPIRFDKLTQRLVWEGEEFIDKSVKGGKPFLLFMSYLQVHTPLYNSVEGFRGRSRHGFYGDNVEELDWSVGRILDFLDSRGLAKDTIVYFSSDNGGHLEETTHTGERGGGHNGQFRGGKCQGSQDGGIRVPGLVRWPGVAKPGGQSDALTSQMDLFPTLLAAIGAQAEGGEGQDGRDLRRLLERPDTQLQHRDFLMQYCGQLLHAVRWSSQQHGTMKLRFYSPDWLPGTEGCGYVCGCYERSGSILHDRPILHNLTSDPTERNPLSPESREYQEVAKVMLQAMELHQQQLQQQPSEFTFSKLIWRPWLQDCCNFPKCNCRDSKFDNRKEA